MGMFNYVDRYRPMFNQPSARQPFQTTVIWDHEKDYTGTGVLSYILVQNTFFDIRVGYVHRWFPLPMQKEAQDLPRVVNPGGLYYYLTTGRFNKTYLRKRFQTGVYFTLFQDNLLAETTNLKAELSLKMPMAIGIGGARTTCTGSGTKIVLITSVNLSGLFTF